MTGFNHYHHYKNLWNETFNKNESDLYTVLTDYQAATDSVFGADLVFDLASSLADSFALSADSLSFSLDSFSFSLLSFIRDVAWSIEQSVVTSGRINNLFSTYSKPFTVFGMFFLNLSTPKLWIADESPYRLLDIQACLSQSVHSLLSGHGLYVHFSSIV